MTVKWTSEETDLLKEFWVNPAVSKQDLVNLFPYRSWDSLTSKVKSIPTLKPFTTYRRPEIDQTILKKLRKIIEESKTKQAR